MVRLRDGNRDGYADLYVVGHMGGNLRLLGSNAGITTAGITTVDWATIEGMGQ
ncbi:hypothetical protein [Streptomyces azureus]|uniref:FG-GAP repeat protein n=1 Tax=Streptomyces azureus TaxID=146537 RepID=A0A0K8PJR0_STRAJ|nr:hypothetical protein [Streptomyces azureus]GAP47649.1 FG-GAP repeat protein [Streptomyces azureus]